MAIEGYASLASVVQGGAIGLHVSNHPAGATFAVKATVARLGASGPEGFSAAFLAGPYAAPPDASTRGCGWPRAYTLDIPPAWPSGVYTATLANADGETADIVFVVRSRVPGESAKILLVYPSTTFQAYNDWGGRSLYGDGERVRKVSFDRPGGMGPGRTAALVRWLARRGIAVEVATSFELHDDPGLLRPYQLVLSAGHDEYWTKEMRDHLEAFVIEGGNAAFFSGNVSFWQARFEDAGRTLVCYRDAVEDPLAGVDNSRVTVQWASAPVNRPQNTMTGVGYATGAGSWIEEGKWKADRYRVNFPEHWVFEGTGLAFGDTFAEGAVGYETDAAAMDFDEGIARATGRDGTPPTFVVLAWADLRHWESQGRGGWATLGVHRSAGTVFTAGSTNWADPIDTSPVIDRITHNVIARLSRRYPDHDWVSAGTAPGVVTMSAGAGGLVATREDGTLIRREASGQNLPWKPTEHAAIGARARVLLATDERVVARASTEGKVFAATRGGRLLARPQGDDDAPWKDIGGAEGIVGMTSINRKLYAVTADGVLWWRQPVLEETPWTFTACAHGVIAIAGSGGRIFGATRDGGLFVRDGFR
jgi:hypothetical protein